MSEVWQVFGPWVYQACHYLASHYGDNVVCVLCRLLGCIRINHLLSWSLLLGLLMSGIETCVCACGCLF